MDAAGTALAQLMRRRMSPVVMVMATPHAEATSRKNELGVVDLLRPFCVLDQIDVPVRTAGELPYRIQDFELRMFYAADIAQPSAEVAEEYLVECVGNASDEAAAALLGDPKDIDVVKKMVESETQASWFQRYCRDYMRTLAFSEHEAIDHPIACLLVVSSKDESPLTQFVDLYNPDCLPTLVKDGAMDPKVLKHYVLLHDVQDGPLDEPNNILLEMRGTFGVNNCGILSINSGPVDSDSPPDDIWTGCLLQPIVSNSTESKQVGDAEVSKKRLGLCLNKGDVAELSDFVLDLTLKQIIPHMEQKIRMLNQQVSATRRGLKNQLKNLWWRKGKEETSDVQAGGQYTFSSMESQIRVLADYAFMLRDYDLALQNYRLLSSDYKTDKAWKRYAGVQEMIGLCLFMMDQSRREAETSLESALNVYQKCGGVTTKYATRTSIWLAEMHKARGQFREGANVLFRAAMLKVEGGQGVSLRAGVLLEQAAYCYLRISSPMLRKYGFHMVLAGNRYTVCSQRKHALRVYRSVLSIFEGQGWKYISDHVHFHLGRLSHFLGNHDLAILHFMKLVTCSHQSPANQSNFLREFLYIVENTVGKDQVLDLELPTIDAEHVHVHFEDHRTYASSSAAAKAENVWSPVEEGLTPSVAVPLHTWLDAPKSLTQAIDFNVCIAGEEIGVDVDFSNPLQIPIDVSSVCLTCEFDDSNANKPELPGKPGLADTEESTVGSSEDQSSSHIEENSVESTVGAMPVDTTPAVLLPEELFQLQAGEKKVVRLKAKPLREGVLKVIGVRWLLAGIATGHRDFAISGPQISTSKSGARSNPPPNQRLKFHILTHMPRLEVSMHELPTKVNTGELHRVVLELYNPSKISVKRIKFKTSHPNVLLVGKAGDLDMEFPSCLEVQAGKEGEHELKQVDIAEFKNGPSVFSFPEDTLLEGGSTVLWPLWLHARQPGTLSLNSIIYYESESNSVGLKYRTVRMTESIQVVPSLKVSVQISPSPLHLQQFLLRLDVKNQNASESFWLRQVSCTGDRWSLAPLLPPVLDKEAISGRDSEDKAAFLSSSVTASQLLPASQTLSLFFKLNVAQRVGKTNNDEVSNIILGPPSSREPLIDIAAGPLADFHVLEKLHQPRTPLPYFLQQKNDAVEGPSGSLNNLPGGEVDVVLISEQQEGEGDAAVQNSGLRVGAHHICHCSVQGAQPFVWVMEGPSSVSHNFLNQPFCEVSVLLTVRNCSIYTGSIKVETQDLVTPPSTPTSPLETEFGWTPLSTSTLPTVDPAEANAVTDAAPSDHRVHRTPTPPFLWCNLRSTSINSLAPGASAKVSLRVAFLAPGIYDLSRYRISWTLLELLQSAEAVELSEMSELHLKTTSATYSAGYAPPENSSSQSGRHDSSDAANVSASGVGSGHPLLLSVVQSNT